MSGRTRRVNVSFGKRTEWVSVAGTAEVVTDRQKIHELWNQVVEAWFPDGPDTPEVVLLHVDSDSAEYWTSPGGTAATVLQWVKSKVTQQPDERRRKRHGRTVGAAPAPPDHRSMLPLISPRRADDGRSGPDCS